MRAPLGKRGGNVFRREHARQHGVVTALDPRDIHEAGGTADERSAGENEFRHRLPSAFGEGARAVADALAAGESIADQRMRLETLKLVERRQIRIFVVEMDDEAD